MKLIAAFLILPFFSFAQNEFPAKDGKVIFQEIDSTVKGSATELKARAKTWFANTFRDSKEVIQMDGDNIIMGKGNFRFEQAFVPFLIQFSVRIDTKENKYRVQFYDITYREGTLGSDKSLESLNEKKGRDKLKGKITSEFGDLLKSIDKTMSKAGTEDF